MPPTEGDGPDHGDGPSHADSGDREASDDEPRDHLPDLDDGCGCVAVWEAMSERRAEPDPE